MYDERRKEDPISRELKALLQQPLDKAINQIKKKVPETLQEDVRILREKLRTKVKGKVDEVKGDIKRQLEKVHVKVSSPDEEQSIDRSAGPVQEVANSVINRNRGGRGMNHQTQKSEAVLTFKEKPQSIRP